MSIRFWLAGAVSAAAVTAGAAAAPVATAATHPARPVAVPFSVGKSPLNRTPDATLSGSWAGYMAVAHQGVKLRSAAADFNVPNGNCEGRMGVGAVHAVGLDGYSSPGALAGVDEGCPQGQAGLYEIQGFYQIGQETGISTSNMIVNPGDALRASVSYSTATAKYTFTVTDIPLDEQVIDVSLPCPAGDACADNSAEVFSGLEAGSGGPTSGTGPLLDYGMANFTGAAVTSFNGTKGTLAPGKLWSSDPLRINLGHGTLATTSPLTGGSAFATVWQAADRPAAVATTHPAAAVPSALGRLPLSRAPGKKIDGSVAGYVAVADTGVQLRYAAASFTVPSLNCLTETDGGVVQGVALGGDSAPYELAGAEVYCSDHAYFATGYYSIGGNNVPALLSVNPGDAMQASVYYNATAQNFTFTLTDVTEGMTIISATVACPTGSTCPLSSAEVITGYADNDAGSPAPLADYGMESFTGAAVTSRTGVRGTLAAGNLWSSAAEIINPGTQTLASVSALAGGGGFATTWHAGKAS